MSTLTEPRHEAPPSTAPALRRAVALAAAAGAMVATLPGRTHGLGLITEPLLAELDLDRVRYAAVNLWATLLGALFCVPAGWLLDRVGTRAVLAGVTVALAGTVLAMSALPAGGWVVGVTAELFVLVLLTRALGQSALSVGSLALMGKSTGRRSLAVAAYSVLVALGFMGAFSLVKHALEQWQAGWRELWGGIGLALLPAAALFALVARPAPVEEEGGPASPAAGHTLGQALATPAFWVFALATSLYGLIAAGLSLFNQSILAERGFDRGVFLSITAYSPLVGLAANLATGWLAAPRPAGGGVPMGPLLAVALAVLAGALAAFPLVDSLLEVYLYATALGAAGGMVTVLFFAVWARAFGAAQLGQVQGAAQMLTVLASALGPLLLAAGQRAWGSYTPLFRQLALAAFILAVAAWFVPLPTPRERP